MIEKFERLKKARISAGFKTARAAADYANIPYGTYSGHENGSRGIKADELKYYSKIFKTPLYWLAFGEYESKMKIELAGILGEKNNNKHCSKRMIEISPPFPVPIGSKALIVTSSEFEPMVTTNDLVIIGKVEQPAKLIGKRVAALFRDQIFIGTLIENKSDTECHFQLPSGKIFLNQKLQWIAEIIGIMFLYHSEPTIQEK